MYLFCPFVLCGFCLPCIHNGSFFTIHGVLIIKTCLISYLVNGSKRSSSIKHDLAYDVQLCLYNKVCVNLFHDWTQIFLILEIRQKLFILHLFLGGDREGIVTFGWHITFVSSFLTERYKNWDHNHINVYQSSLLK